MMRQRPSAAWRSRCGRSVACEPAVRAPAMTSETRPRSKSMTPYPVTLEPGSIPRILTGCALRSGGLQFALVHVEICPDVLHVVVLFQSVDQVEHLASRRAFGSDGVLRGHGDL